jgi:hypothetical protein
MGMIIESIYQQLAKFIAYLAVPLLAICQCPVNTPFATAYLLLFLDEELVDAS